MLRFFVALFLGLFFHSLLAGCNSAEWMSGRIEPQTSVRVKMPGIFAPEIEFKDTKNNTIVVRDLKFNPETKEVGLGELSILNDSSGVIASDAARMPLILDMQKRAFDHYDRVSDNVRTIFEKGFELGGKLGPMALPGLTVAGPLGGSATASNAAIEALIQKGIEAYIAKQGGTLPVPTPGNP